MCYLGYNQSTSNKNSSVFKENCTMTWSCIVHISGSKKSFFSIRDISFLRRFFFLWLRFFLFARNKKKEMNKIPGRSILVAASKRLFASLRVTVGNPPVFNMLHLSESVCRWVYAGAWQDASLSNIVWLFIKTFQAFVCRNTLRWVVKFPVIFNFLLICLFLKFELI